VGEDHGTELKRLVKEERPVRTILHTPVSAPHQPNKGSRRPPVANKPPHTRTKTTTNATPQLRKTKVFSFTNYIIF